MIDGLWSLPGPARLAASVGDALRGGGSCAVVAPARMRDNDQWVFGATEAADVDVDHIAVDPRRPPAAVFAEHCGADWDTGPDLVRELAQHEVLAGRVIGLALPADTPDWAKFVAAFLTALPGVPEPQRPQLLVFCGPDDLDLFRNQRLPLTERWWWGTVGRLDTTIAAAQALGEHADPVAVSCITELCGFDLDFVDRLAIAWDGSLANLLDLVQELPGPQATVEEWSSLASSVGTASPAGRFRPDWDRGLIDVWDRYEPFLSPTAVPEPVRLEVLRTRLWRGQLRELMPLVDEERARLESWAKSGPIADPNTSFPIEIGNLAWLIRRDPALKRRASATRRAAATWLWTSRNALAHRDIIAPGDITEGLRLLDADRRDH